MASGARTKTVPTYLECEVCENKVEIHRRKGRQREKNHVKHMHCFKCKEVTAHIEKKEELFLPDWLRK